MSKALASPTFILGYPVLLAVLQVAFQEWLGSRRRRETPVPPRARRRRRPVWDQPPEVDAPGDEGSLSDIAIDREQTRRRIRRERKALKRVTGGRDSTGSQGHKTSIEEDLLPLIAALALGCAVAAGYLAARTAIQLSLLTLSGFALGSLISIVRGMRRRGEIAADWRWFLIATCIPFLLGFVCVWQLRDPLFAGTETRYGTALAAYDRSGFRGVIDTGGRDAILFFALQSLAVVTAVLAFYGIARLVLGLLAEVADRRGRQVRGWRLRLLDDDRDSGASPWGGARTAIATISVAVVFASGAAAAGFKAIELKPTHFSQVTITRTKGAVVVRGTVKPELIGSTELVVRLIRDGKAVRTLRRTVGTRPFMYSIATDSRGKALRPGLYRVALNLDGKPAASREIRLPRKSSG